MTDQIDCLIVGGGPAGLTAAIYLARFHRSVVVIDADEGRMKMIPVSHNHAGFPGGIAGGDLLARLRGQAAGFGARLLAGQVSEVARQHGRLVVSSTAGTFAARAVLMATGVVNHRPDDMTDAVHDDAVARGVLRYCPICDAFEQSGKRIGVLGCNEHALAEAMFLRTYSEDVAMFGRGGVQLDADARAQAQAAGVQLVDQPLVQLDASTPTARATLEGGEVIEFDTVYVALGSRTRNELGKTLGCELEAEDKCFTTDEKMRTSIPGVYAAGDAIKGLDQISFATGSAAIAAVAMHNDLRTTDGEVLEDQTAALSA